MGVSVEQSGPRRSLSREGGEAKAGIAGLRRSNVTRGKVCGKGAAIKVRATSAVHETRGHRASKDARRSSETRGQTRGGGKNSISQNAKGILSGSQTLK